MLTPAEERKIIQDFFVKVRQVLMPYTTDRQIVFSNSQLFGFLLISPVTLAIASDGNLDFAETNMLIEIASFFERNVLPSIFDDLPQPEGRLSGADFRRIIYSELRYLCLTMDKYEASILEALKLLLQLDRELTQDKDTEVSIAKKILDTMSVVIYNNSGEDRIEEKKVRKILEELGISKDLGLRL